MSARCFQEATKMNSRMTDAYAAGLIDGEGCISISTHNKETIFYARVDVGMSLKGLPVLELLMKKYGGSIRTTRKATEKWEEARAWVLLGKPLTAFLEAILPHLILKRENAELALRLQRMIASLPRRPNGSASWGEQAKKDGKAIRALMQEANRKGPQHSQSAGWFARRVGDTWITPQRDLLSPHGWEEFSGTWPRSGFTQNFTAFRLPPLVRLTDEIGSGSWPIPTVDDSNNVTRASGQWPTLHANCSTGPGRQGRDGGDNLQTAVAMFPTPTANRRDGLQSHGVNVVTGSLNPTWVEWLMGFPLGWTDLGHSATPSCLKSPKSSAGQSCCRTLSRPEGK
jgi:hypothetical protein